MRFRDHSYLENFSLTNWLVSTGTFRAELPLQLKIKVGFKLHTLSAT